MVSKLNKLIETYHSPECEFNVDKSIEICKEILKIKPDLIEFQENLACNYYNKSEYEKSIDLFEKCIEKGGNNDDSYLMIGLSYLKLNQREKAFETIKNTKDKENYLFNHFKLYEELEEYDKVIEYGDKVLDLNPENTYVLHTMSNIYDEMGDDERSLFYLDELSNHFPIVKSIEILRLYSLKRYDEAIKIFEENKKSGIFDSNLEEEKFNCIIGLSYYEIDKPYESLKYLIESDRLKPEVDKKMAIAKNYINLGKYDNAHKYLQDALKIDELDATCLFFITETSYYREEYINAIEYANKLLNNHQLNKVFFVLAAIYFDLGDDETAFKNVKIARDLTIGSMEEEFEPYLIYIARRLSKAGFNKRAENIYKKIEMKCPDFLPVYYERANHYKRVGNDELAQKDFKKYNELREKWRREWESYEK